MDLLVGVMFHILVLSVVDCRFDPWSGPTKDYKLHRWCNGWRACLECSRSWVRAQIGSNQRL